MSAMLSGPDKQLLLQMGGKLPFVRAENARRLSGATGKGRYGWKVVGSGHTHRPTE